MKNKPILFIDEKPFWYDDAIAIEQYNVLKRNLAEQDSDRFVEFFFKENKEFPFDFSSTEFKDIVQGRSLICIHNSYPHTKDKTVFPLNIINLMKNHLPNGCTLIRFSGQMYRRGYDDEQMKEVLKDQLKMEQPLIKKDLMIERDDIYNNFHLFIKNWTEFEDSADYFILKYGSQPRKGEAQELQQLMRQKCWEEKKGLSSLAGILEKSKSTRQLKTNWKSEIESDFDSILKMVSYDMLRKQETKNNINSSAINYQNYFEIVNNVINNINE